MGGLAGGGEVRRGVETSSNHLRLPVVRQRAGCLKLLLVDATDVVAGPLGDDFVTLARNLI